MKTKSNKEKRFITKEYRAKEDKKGNRYIEGYASVFNHRSKLIFENDEFFYEIIEQGAFDKVLKRNDLNVVLTYQHNTDVPLARLNVEKGIKNLELSVDKKGLYFRAKIANTTDGNNAYELVKSRDIFECSFIFTVARDSFEEDEDGNLIRRISDIDNLFDVSVVVEGAYSNTDVQVAERKYNKIKEEKNRQDMTIEEIEKLKEEIKEELVITLKEEILAELNDSDNEDEDSDDSTDNGSDDNSDDVQDEEKISNDNDEEEKEEEEKRSVDTLERMFNNLLDEFELLKLNK